MSPQSEKKMANGDRLAETMTKREAFAIQMMAAMRVANPGAGRQCVALAALEDAGALLAELEKCNG